VNVLERITGVKRGRIAEAKAVRPLAELKAAVTETAAPATRRLEDRLRQAPPAFICEVKRGSPSRGLFAPDLDERGLARIYYRAHADAISVLTEQDYFYARPDVMERVRSAGDLPILQKDFFLDPYQIYAARLLGADVILLIVAALSREELADLLAVTDEVGLGALVEVHDEAELDTALAVGARIVGVNNRDLQTFKVDLATTERLAPRVPSDRVVIAESGIHTPDDVSRLCRAGVRGFLIGEALVLDRDPEGLLRTFQQAAAAHAAGEGESA
jgi:indole-3-glycerol phosphate synthase